MPKRSAVNPNVANGANRVSHVLGSRPRGHRLLSRAQQSIAVLLLMLTGLQAHAADSELEAIQDSVIKIYTTQAAPDYFTPWRLLTPRQSSGSGSVIKGNQILTNAHVIANASYVQAQKHNDP